jgi:hypothetical protein
MTITHEALGPGTGARPPAASGTGPRTTVTLGPFMVALTAQDRELQRPTVVVAVAYIAPSDRGRAASASRAVQARLWQVVGSGVPTATLQDVAEFLFERFTEPAWPAEGGDVVEHGVGVVQVSVSLLPQDLASGMAQPVATVSVTSDGLGRPARLDVTESGPA